MLLPHCPLWPPEPYETQQAKAMPFFRGIRLVMSHGPYIKLIAGFLFTSLAFMVSGALICSAWAGRGMWNKGWGRPRTQDGTKPEGQVEWRRGEQRSLEHGEHHGGSAPTTSPVSLPLFPPRSPVPQLVEGNFALFCTYTLGFRNEFQNLLLAIMVRVGPPRVAEVA